MGAKEKLNAAAVRGIVVVAAVLGLFFESWSVFFGLAGVGIACALHARDIRA